MTTTIVSTVLAAMLFTLHGPGPAADACIRETEAALTRGAARVRVAPSWVEPGMPGPVWRLIEASTDVPDEDVSSCLLDAAEDEARAALAVEPDDVSRRFALGVVLGLRADRNGGRTKVRAAADLHEELDRVLRDDPTHARARHLLGRLHAGVMRMDRFTRWIATNLLGGGPLKAATWAGAEQNLAFAESQAPQVAEHHYELARLFQDTDRDSLAAVEAGHVLELSAASPMEEVVRRKALVLQEELEESMPELRGRDR